MRILFIREIKKSVDFKMWEWERTMNQQKQSQRWWRMNIVIVSSIRNIKKSRW